MNSPDGYRDNFHADLERVEIGAFSGFYGSADDKAMDRCGISLPDIGPYAATIASKVDVLALNRVVGLGLEEPADERTIDRIVEEYRNAGAPRFFLQLHPSALPSSLTNLLEARGFYHYNNWIKLYREIESFPAAKTNLQIAQAGREQGDAFAEIVTSCFGWPEITRSWISDFTGHPDWRFYMAFDNDRPVATGAFYVNGEYAWIDFATTLPEYRGRGAQTAIAERRAKDAAALGCRWLVVETAEETSEHPAPSYRNMIRLGFQVAYIRPNYIYKFDK